MQVAAIFFYTNSYQLDYNALLIASPNRHRMPTIAIVKTGCLLIAFSNLSMMLYCLISDKKEAPTTVLVLLLVEAL